MVHRESLEKKKQEQGQEQMVENKRDKNGE